MTKKKIKIITYGILTIIPLGFSIMVLIEFVIHREIVIENIRTKNFKLKIWER